MSTPRLVLASTSPYRRALAQKLRWPFEARAPKVDEESIKRPDLGPRALAEYLAESKVRSLIDDEPGACIVGGDQLVAFGEEIIGKPKDTEDAVRQLRRLSGQSFELVTAMGALYRGRYEARIHLSRFRTRKLSEKQIRRYIEVDEPFDCAGSFRLEDHGILLFESIETTDPLASMGLSLVSLVSLLEGFGFEIPGPV